MAVFFTVPAADGLRLDTITVAVSPFATSPTTLAFKVAPDNGGQPSTWMVGSGVQLSGETVFTFTDPFTTPLTKGATYWLVLDGDPNGLPSGSSHSIWFNSTTTIVASGQLLASGAYQPPLTPGNASASWSDLGASGGVFLPGVTITATPVPKPAATAFVSGALLLGFVAWRRIRAA